MTELKREESNPRPNSCIISRISYLISHYASRFTLHALRTRLPSFKAHLIFWPLMVAGLALDLWSKKAVFDWLQQSRRTADSVSIINGFLRLVVAENAGAAFGIAAGQHYLLVAVSVIALIVVFAVFLLSPPSRQRKLVHVALGLFIAGVCGNLYDRIFNNGLVRDFIDVVYWPGRHWPAFNIADTMLCIGVGLMIISTVFTGKPSRKRARQHK